MFYLFLFIYLIGCACFFVTWIATFQMRWKSLAKSGLWGDVFWAIAVSFTSWVGFITFFLGEGPVKCTSYIRRFWFENELEYDLSFSGIFNFDSVKEEINEWKNLSNKK